MWYTVCLTPICVLCISILSPRKHLDLFFYLDPKYVSTAPMFSCHCAFGAFRLAHCFNTLTPGQNRCHFEDDIFTYHFATENVCQNLLPSILLTIFQHWVRYWLGAKQAKKNITRTDISPVYWHICASSGPNSLTHRRVNNPINLDSMSINREHTTDLLNE